MSAPVSVIAEPKRVVSERLHDLEQALRRLPGGADSSEVDRSLHALRAAVAELEQAEREERHRFGHDLRVALNAIAGWTHILRIDAAAGSPALRAVEVLERNVRAITKLLEAHTDAIDR